jgi:hypothetical protein
VPGVVRDLAEALGPIVATPSEDFDRAVADVELYPVAVELDFVYPALAVRHLIDCSRQGRFNEIGYRCFGADSGRLLALKRHKPLTLLFPQKIGLWEVESSRVGVAVGRLRICLGSCVKFLRFTWRIGWVVSSYRRGRPSGGHNV